MPAASPQEAKESVSLIQLIATPEKYEGKTVLITGFLRLEFEGNSICMHREDCDQNLYQNSLWVNPSKDLFAHSQELNNHYITLVGVFTAKRNGHMGLWPGEISIISYIRHAT